MGLGKTFVGSQKMNALDNRVNLVICQKSKIKDWLEHFETYYRWYNSRVQNDIYDLTDAEQFCLFTHSANTKTLGMVIGVINYELAWRRKDLLSLKDFTLMLDESSLIQNDTAKQSKFVLKLNATNVILLSGTPTSGKYENLWSQSKLLGWDISKALYNNHYINWKQLEVFDGSSMRTRTVKVVDKQNPYKNVERLKNKLREHGAVFMKTDEVMGLPEQNFIDVFVPKAKEYDRFQEESIVEIGDKTLVGDTSLTKLLYSRQLCGIYSREKLQAYKDMLGGTSDRLIVFYNFTDEVKLLIQATNESGRPWGIISGEHKILAPYENDDDSVLFVQYQSGSMGLNLQKANKIIYYSLPIRSELFEQSKKRIHRIGQQRACFYYVMKCRGTVEEGIHDTLNQLRDYTDELFREGDSLSRLRKTSRTK